MSPQSFGGGILLKSGSIDWDVPVVGGVSLAVGDNTGVDMSVGTNG
jgi:hypothetical protein